MSTYSNMPVCDLRHLNDPEVIRKIEEIKNIALLVFPKDVSEDVKAAFQSVPVKNTAATLWLNRDDPVSIVNGMSEMGIESFKGSGHTVLLVNGIVVIDDMPEDAQVSLYLNGVVILHEKLRNHPGISSLMTNGIRTFAAFDHCKINPEFVLVDADMVKWLEDKTLVLAGREVRIAGRCHGRAAEREAHHLPGREGNRLPGGCDRVRESRLHRRRDHPHAGRR